MSERDSPLRYEFPLLDFPASRIVDRARELTVKVCYKDHAVGLVEAWHSRLPKTQSGPWMFAFSASFEGRTYAVALWNNPSARGLPQTWLELRRLAAAPDAPRNTCSFMLGRMSRYFKLHHPEIERLISYQDSAVHTGTIYKASNWTQGAVSKARARDRSKPRVGTRRDYRSNLNGAAPDAAEKIRWEFSLALKGAA
jgi:hypothetical protein